MSQSPDHPPAARNTDLMVIPAFAKLMMPCLVFRRDGLVADFGSERDQNSIEV